MRNNMPKIENEKILAEFIQENGGQLWIVGGAVRDELMGKKASDKDYMITGMNVQDLPFEKIAGSDFPVFLVEIDGKTCEIAMARKEKKVGNGYHGFTFHTDKNVTVYDDLFRRDLTINAIAKNVLTGIIVDPFDGMTDIKNKILRHVSAAFKDDPLRVYRVARFAAKFNFQIADETLGLMHEMKSELFDLKPERVLKELDKVLICETPSVFFKVLKSANLLDVHFYEVEMLDVPDKHDGTAFEHTMRVMDFGISPLIRFGLLVHDFGKGFTPIAEHPAHHDHDQLGVKVVENFCERLKISNNFREFGISCAREHMRIKSVLEMRPGKILKLLTRNRKNIDALIIVSGVDSVWRDDADKNMELQKFVKITILFAAAIEAEKNINGDDLIAEGIEPGPKLGELLFQRRVNIFKTIIKNRQLCKN